ncbi:MAG: phosphonate ABC transporter ATP-binding protein [Rhodospirillales bacterium]|nr:phosphonate ABC transporter ATP-binding protein [Rhodospirillales bacterium]
MLKVEELVKVFGDTRAVDGISLEIPRGQMVGVIGRSGAGKSTLLRLINRLIEPTVGRIQFDGTDITGLRGRALRDWRARCAMVFQQFNLVHRLDVVTNVLVGRVRHRSATMTLLKNFSVSERAMAVRALDRLEMAEYGLQRAGTLSGGQQQRVAIARALVQEPRMILADEPIASLDPNNARRVMDALRRINREDGITVLCNLHHLDTARAYCDRIIGMAGGKIVFDGAPADLDMATMRDIFGSDAFEAIDGISEGDLPSIPAEAEQNAVFVA